MLNPLKIASAGYLKRTTKAVLIIAVAGYLNYGGQPHPSPSPTPEPFIAGGIAGDYKLEHAKGRKIILMEDDEIITILKIWLECKG